MDSTGPNLCIGEKGFVEGPNLEVLTVFLLLLIVVKLIFYIINYRVVNAFSNEILHHSSIMK